MRRWLPVLAALMGHWRRHPVQLAAILLGLALATALWSGVQALNAEARASYDRAAELLGGTRLPTITRPGGGRMDVADFVGLRRAGLPVAPVLEGDVILDDRPIRLVGIDPVTLPEGAGALSVVTDTERLPDFMAPPWLALAEPRTLASLAGTAGLPPLARGDGLPPDTLLVDIALAERLLDAQGRLSRLILPEGWAGSLPEGFDHLTLAPPRGDSELAALTDSFHLNLTAFGFLSFTVGLFIVYATVGLVHESRRGLMRTMRALGVAARTLAGVLIAEMVILALIAGAAGTVLGYLLASALLPDVAASLRGLYGARVAGSLALDPGWWAAGIAISVAGALAASAGALIRAARLPLSGGARPAAWAAHERRRLRLQAGLAVAALAIGAAVPATGWLPALPGGFVLMGGLLVAGALLLPGILALMLGLGGRLARRPLARWAWADARQQLPGLGFALMALLLALSVNIGVGTMVASFRATFTDWLDRRLAAEVYLSAPDETSADRIAAWAAADPRIDRVLPIRSVQTETAQGAGLEVFGVIDDATYREDWPLIDSLSAPWDRVLAGEAALLSEQLARRLSIGPGDAVTLTGPEGPWTLLVAGTYPDYGNPRGQAVVALTALEARWPDLDGRRMAFRLEAAETAAVIDALRAAFDLDPGAVTDQASLKALSLAVFDRTFAVTVALTALTLAVAGAALFCGLLTLATMRLRQVAPLWAMGVRRATLARLELIRLAGLGALTALAALPVGLAMAWVLTRVINVAAFGWRLPLIVFPDQWAITAALAVATALLAAAWPAWRLARAEPADLLKGFSSER